MTLKEIAKEAGVSVSTVSRVINQENTKAASPEVQAEAAARREALQKKYQLAREGYVQRVFDIVTGKRDE